jgi:hypothetical protein
MRRICTRSEAARSTRLRPFLAAIAAAFPLVQASPAGASETITYSYDARGRLKQAQHSGTVNNGVTTTYAYDKANNRTTRTTTGAP